MVINKKVIEAFLIYGSIILLGIGASVALITTALMGLLPNISYIPKLALAAVSTPIGGIVIGVSVAIMTTISTIFFIAKIFRNLSIKRAIFADRKLECLTEEIQNKRAKISKLLKQINNKELDTLVIDTRINLDDLRQNIIPAKKALCKKIEKTSLMIHKRLIVISNLIKRLKNKPPVSNLCINWELEEAILNYTLAYVAKKNAKIRILQSYVIKKELIAKDSKIPLAAAKKVQSEQDTAIMDYEQAKKMLAQTITKINSIAKDEKREITQENRLKIITEISKEISKAAYTATIDMYNSVEGAITGTNTSSSTYTYEKKSKTKMHMPERSMRPTLETFVSVDI